MIDAVIDLTGKIRFGFAPSLTAVTVTIHDIDLDLGRSDSGRHRIAGSSG